MRKALCVVLLAAMTVFGGKTVNGRYVPAAEDWDAYNRSHGVAYHLDSLLSDLARVIGTDALSLSFDTISGLVFIDSVSLDYMAGNPSLDSLDLGYLELDTLRGNPSTDSILITYVDINGGAIDGTIIGASSADSAIVTGLSCDSAKVVDNVVIGSGHFITKIDTIGSTDTLLIIFGSADSLIIVKDR